MGKDRKTGGDKSSKRKPKDLSSPPVEEIMGNVVEEASAPENVAAVPEEACALETEAPVPEKTEAPALEIVASVPETLTSVPEIVAEETPAPESVAKETSTPAPETAAGVETADEKKKPKFEMRPIPPEVAATEVTCVICGKKGKAGDNNGERYFWHNIPIYLDGTDQHVQAVDLDCATKRAGEIKGKFGLWFKTHKTLPVLPYTLKKQGELRVARQARIDKAIDKAKAFMQRNGKVADPSRKCYVCGATHGEFMVTENEDGSFYAKAILVETVVNLHHTREEMMRHLVDYNCRPKVIARAEARGEEIHLGSFERAEEYFDEQERMDELIASGAVHPNGKPKTRNGQPADYYPRKNENNGHRRTGTYD